MRQRNNWFVHEKEEKKKKPDPNPIREPLLTPFSY